MIFSTPKSEDTLRFNDEVKIVTDKLSYSKLFLLESPKYKVENIEIAPNIITEEPNIVHFSLHGKKNKGLVFSDRYENASIVNLIEFKNTLDILGGAKIDCFIFNVCHSNEFAKLASTYATYAIGMNDLINEPDAAVAFSEGFYSMLKVVDNIETAFRAAVNLLYNRRIQLKQADRKEDYKVPELFKNGDLLLDAEILNLK
ncbi:MAG: hypothetical protein B6I20_04545 [Bacteroidetes bacterium 4572_117]|nr:MAG: hypothetical protein B6I20_04545 [Bacteroidetes bacterium 4572_117]